MRYSIISKGLTPIDIERECRRFGAKNIKPLPAMKQLFCELDPEQAQRLSLIPGLKVKLVGKVTTDQVIAAPTLVGAQVESLNLYETFNDLRQAYSPPLLGQGLTVAVLDSGVRESHQALEDKVVYRANFSESDTNGDIFGHGTSIAYVIAGEYGEKSGVAPGASLINLKVLNDDGEGSEEAVVEAIDRVCNLVDEAIKQGLPLTDPMYPNTINLSLGAEDDGDPENPMRVACHTAVEEYGIQVIAAAGNQGPRLSTVMTPASDPAVIAVGGLRSWEFDIWEQSSRGPTLEGIIKPEFVCWAESIEMADCGRDDAYTAKSGTSFATSILTGLDGLLWDLTRRVYGQDSRITYYNWIPYAYAYCIKPEGVQVAKDNSYGYGLPAVGVMISRLLKPAAPVTTTMESVLPMMLMVGMMPAIMKVG